MELPTIHPLPRGSRDSWIGVLPDVQFQNELAARRERAIDAPTNATAVEPYLAALLALAPLDLHLAPTGPPFSHQMGERRIEYRSLNGDLIVLALVYAMANMTRAQGSVSAILSAAWTTLDSLPIGTVERCMHDVGLAVDGPAGIAFFKGLADLVDLDYDVNACVAAAYESDDSKAIAAADVYRTLATQYAHLKLRLAQTLRWSRPLDHCDKQERKLLATAAATLARKCLMLTSAVPEAEYLRAYLLLRYAARFDADQYTPEFRRLETEAFTKHNVNLLEAAARYHVDEMTTEQLSHRSSFTRETTVVADSDHHPLLGQIRMQRRHLLERPQSSLNARITDARQQFQVATLRARPPPTIASPAATGWYMVPALVAYARLARLPHPDLLARARAHLLASGGVTADQLDGLTGSGGSTPDLDQLLADLGIGHLAPPTPSPVAAAFTQFTSFIRQAVTRPAASTASGPMTFAEWFERPPTTAQEWRATGRVPAPTAWRDWIPRDRAAAVLSRYSDQEWAEVLGLSGEVVRELGVDVGQLGAKWDAARASKLFGLSSTSNPAFRLGSVMLRNQRPNK